MALQDILDKIEQEGADKIAKLKNEFNESLKQLQEKYKEKQSEEKDKIAQSGEENARKIKEKASILAKLESKNTLLTAKGNSINEAKQALIKALASSSKYQTYLTKILKSLNKQYSEGFIVPAKGKTEETRKAIKESGSTFAITKEEGKFEGGFILKSKNIEIDCTFESIIQKELADKLEEIFSNTLF